MEKSSRSGGADSGQDKPHVTWDEETIALHDLQRGTRMKIEEPNTPYHHYGSDMEEEDEGQSDRNSITIDAEMVGAAKDALPPASNSSSTTATERQPQIEWSELQSKLEKVQSKQSEWDSSDEEGSEYSARDSEGKKIQKDPRFAEKRKLHYNEFEMMKQWKQRHHDDEDGEEEEGVDNDDR